MAASHNAAGSRSTRKIVTRSLVDQAFKIVSRSVEEVAVTGSLRRTESSA
jgi:ATP-dependent protease Clp ATPase subunit